MVEEILIPFQFPTIVKLFFVSVKGKKTFFAEIVSAYLDGNLKSSAADLRLLRKFGNRIKSGITRSVKDYPTDRF